MFQESLIFSELEILFVIICNPTSGSKLVLIIADNCPQLTDHGLQAANGPQHIF